MPEDAHQQWRKFNDGVNWTNHAVGATQKLRYGQLDDLGLVVARPGREAAFKRLGAVSEGLGHLGNVVNVSVCSKAQWDRDKGERPEMGTVEHGTRCAYRGVVVGGAGVLGGELGTAAGSALALALAGAYSASIAGAAAGTAVAPVPAPSCAAWSAASSAVSPRAWERRRSPTCSSTTPSTPSAPAPRRRPTASRRG